MQTFGAKIYKAGINPCVDVPERVSASFRKSGYISVKGTINNKARFRTNLVPSGSGNYRLFINSQMRTAANVRPGSKIVVNLVFDSQPPTLPMPKLLAEALSKNPQAQTAWHSMAPSHQREWLAYFNNLKTPDALERNIKKAIAKLTKKPAA